MNCCQGSLEVAGWRVLTTPPHVRPRKNRNVSSRTSPSRAGAQLSNLTSLKSQTTLRFSSGGWRILTCPYNTLPPSVLLLPPYTYIPGVLDHRLEHLCRRHDRLSSDVRAPDHVLLSQEHLSHRRAKRETIGGGEDSRFACLSG